MCPNRQLLGHISPKNLLTITNVFMYTMHKSDMGVRSRKMVKIWRTNIPIFGRYLTIFPASSLGGRGGWDPDSGDPQKTPTPYACIWFLFFDPFMATKQ